MPACVALVISRKCSSCVPWTASPLSVISLRSSAARTEPPSKRLARRRAPAAASWSVATASSKAAA
eukprot:12407118-Alexandrium_andersonii.AAC.1